MSTPEYSAKIDQFTADLISLLDKHVFGTSANPSASVLSVMADMFQMSARTISAVASLKFICDNINEKIEQEQKARLN